MSNGSQTTGLTYTITVWAKSATGSDQEFGLFFDGSGSSKQDFTATSEWQRFELTYTAGNTSAVGICKNLARIK